MIEGGLHFGLGSTLAVHRPALQAAGGLIGLVDQLADDYEMGAAYNWRGFVDHQLRWLRTVRDARPGGYFGLVFTHGLGWAFLNLIASGVSPLSVWIFAMSLFLRLAMAMRVGSSVLSDHQLIEGLILVPLRDLLQMGLWIAGLAGNTIVWRGQRFALKDGKLMGMAGERS
jgi:ceramide glucosyltransferase